MIDPGTNPNGETVEAYCRRRWGGAGWTGHLISEGKKDGAKFADWKWWPHTLKAHQLVQYFADKREGTGGVISTDLVNQLLFQAEYEQGQNISDVQQLMEVVKKLKQKSEESASGSTKKSIDLKELESYLENNSGAKKVQEEIALGRKNYRISGVPFFVVSNGKHRPYGFSGAQASSTFVNIFEELAEDS